MVYGVTHNMAIDTDPQQQEAVSPHVLVVRSFLRCARSWRNAPVDLR
jgi:hypothetical protein